MVPNKKRFAKEQGENTTARMFHDLHSAFFSEALEKSIYRCLLHHIFLAVLDEHALGVLAHALTGEVVDGSVSVGLLS